MAITISDIIFIVAHRLNDGRGRSTKDNGDCCYRTEDGNNCAVGACLTPDLLDKVDAAAMNGWNASSLLKYYGTDEQLVVIKEINDFFGFGYQSDGNHLLTDLQCVHDAKSNWCDYGTSNERGTVTRLGWSQFTRVVERYVKDYELWPQVAYMPLLPNPRLAH